MALKAGRVGVNPRGVDKEGMPALDTSAYYDKTEADAKFATNTALATKADQSNLTANSKDFVFAYSGGQYGYKAGSTGDFHPFEEAGVTYMGWVKPADLDDTGLTPGTGVQISSGGLYVSGNNVYVDVVFYNSAEEAIASDTALVTGCPTTASGNKYFINRSIVHTTSAEAEDDLVMLTTSSDTKAYVAYTINGGLYINGGLPAGRYLHIYGLYKK